MTFSDFMKGYEALKTTNPTYRLGQHFITLFIKDSSSEEMQKLWNEKDEHITMSCINEVLRKYHWATHDLPEIPKNK